MLLTLSFIGKWKWWYRVLRYREGLGRWIPCGMDSGWLAAEGEDLSWLEWKR